MCQAPTQDGTEVREVYEVATIEKGKCVPRRAKGVEGWPLPPILPAEGGPSRPWSLLLPPEGLARLTKRERAGGRMKQKEYGTEYILCRTTVRRKG